MCKYDRKGRVQFRLFRSYFDSNRTLSFMQGEARIGLIWPANGNFLQVNGLCCGLCFRLTKAGRKTASNPLVTNSRLLPAPKLRRFSCPQNQPADFVGEALVQLGVSN